VFRNAHCRCDGVRSGAGDEKRLKYIVVSPAGVHHTDSRNPCRFYPPSGVIRGRNFICDEYIRPVATYLMQQPGDTVFRIAMSLRRNAFDAMTLEMPGYRSFFSGFQEDVTADPDALRLEIRKKSLDPR
jgi:hypothetical protein